MGNQTPVTARTATPGLIKSRPGHPPRGDALILICGAESAGLSHVSGVLARWGLQYTRAISSVHNGRLSAGSEREAWESRGAAREAARATALAATAGQRVTVSVLVDPGPQDWLVAEVVAAPVAVCVTDSELSRVIEALLRGTRAILRTEDVADELVPVLSLVARGYVSLPAVHLGELSGWLGVRPAEHPGGLPDLTARERDILGSIADGDSVRQTAVALGIAVKTVENTQSRLFRKLGVHNRPGALRLAYRLGLIEPHRQTG